MNLIRFAPTPVLWIARLAMPIWLAGLSAFVAADGVRAGDAPPAAVANEDDIRRLIRQLGDKDYFARQRAEAQLGQLGVEAIDALGEAITDEDLEISARAKRLIQGIRVEWVEKDAPTEVKKLLNGYDLQNFASRQAKMRLLAREVSIEAGIPALCRLARFEKSARMSKLAAIELIGSQKPGEPLKKEVAELVRRHLGGSRRIAAVWLLAWLRFCEDPAAGSDWAELVDVEEALLRNSPAQTSPEIVAALLRFQVGRLKRLGRVDEAMGAVARLIRLEKGDAETLIALVEWLIEQKGWKAIDELADRFGPQIAVNPALLYRLADARLTQGDKQQAEDLAEQALKLYPGQQREDLVRHYLTAMDLGKRGRFAWARREYQRIIDNAEAAKDIALRAHFTLAEMLHDQGEELDAAEVLQKAVESLGPNRPADVEVAGRTLGELRSRMNYFFACHWQAKDDPAKHRAYLDKALDDEAADVDVLIACYRLPDQPPEYRGKIRKLIEKSAAELRETIADAPDTAIAYNQLAWLIGNTEGDLDEALKCSKKSLELSFEEKSGYYDTLAHVYCAKGDFENAVKYQEKAAELDPHSGQILRALAVFRKKLAKKERKTGDRSQETEGKKTEKP